MVGTAETVSTTTPPAPVAEIRISPERPDETKTRHGATKPEPRKVVDKKKKRQQLITSDTSKRC